MSEQKHTPGPWKVEHTFGEMIIRDGEDYPIATMTDEDTLPEAKANAELIARAPELLQQVAELKAEVEKLTDKLRFADKHIALLQGKEATELSRLREEQRELVEALKARLEKYSEPNSDFLQSLLSKFEAPKD